MGKDSNRKIAGYIRTYTVKEGAEIQEQLILGFCRDFGIHCDHIYKDLKYNKGNSADIRRAGYLQMQLTRCSHVYREWTEMLIQVLNGEIGCILVDTKLRLYHNTEEMQVFEKICSQYNVTVIEVGLDSKPKVACCKRVAVYHFTDVSEKRPAIVSNNIDRLYQFASQNKSWEVNELYLDRSIRRYGQSRMKQLLKKADQYDIILVKNFYHLSRKMISFWKVALEMYQRGLTIISSEEGEIIFLTPEEIFNRPLRIAVYDRARSLSEEENKGLLLERIRVFIEHQENSYKIEKIYYDCMSDKKQSQLEQLIKEASNYDLVIMETFGKIHDTTDHFYKFKRKIEKPLFSLKEGGIL